MGPIEERSEWEKLVANQPAEEGEVLTELSRFADLWRYLQERQETLGAEIVEAISQVHQLSLPERIARMKEINQTLLERIGDVGERAQLRQ